MKSRIIYEFLSSRMTESYSVSGRAICFLARGLFDSPDTLVRLSRTTRRELICDMRFHWSAPLSSCSNWSDHRAESDSESVPLRLLRWYHRLAAQKSSVMWLLDWLTVKWFTGIASRGNYFLLRFASERKQNSLGETWAYLADQTNHKQDDTCSLHISAENGPVVNEAFHL